MTEAIDRETGRAFGVAVKEPIRRQVRPLGEKRRTPADGLSDRMRPGD